jgi:hypothetical protein
MLLASFISRLAGTPARQVRHAKPQTLREVLKIVLSVQEAEKQERFNEGFLYEVRRFGMRVTSSFQPCTLGKRG